MSFSLGVKEELARNIPKARHCQLAEIAAILSFLGRIERNDGIYRLIMETENVLLAKHYFELVKKALNVQPELTVAKSTNTRNRIYTVSIEEEEAHLSEIEALKLSLDEEPRNKVPSALLVQRDCCKRSFLRGAFFAGGSMIDPEKGYHLEIVLTNAEQEQFIIEQFGFFGINLKTVERKGRSVLYLKDAEEISDALNIFGAYSSLLELENVRIIKGVRNDVNRRVNCETANINKTVSASVKQIEDINLIKKMGQLRKLPQALQETANLRLKYPEASLNELAMLFEPPIGKSGVNHRLKKISEIADTLR